MEYKTIELDINDYRTDQRLNKYAAEGWTVKLMEHVFGSYVIFLLHRDLT